LYFCWILRISGWSCCITIIERVPFRVSGVTMTITNRVSRMIATA
jgi:hypothetical protein